MSETQKPEKRDFTPEEARAFWQDARARVADGNCDFRGVFFPEDPDDQYFGFAEFGGDADLSGAAFGGEVNFWDAKFGGSANFENAKFGGEAFLTLANFGGVANFVGAEFDGVAYFTGAKFGGVASFNDAKFGRDARLAYANFGGVAYFLGAEFGGAADLMDAKFGGDANFRNAVFHQEATMQDAVSHGVFLVELPRGWRRSARRPFARRGQGHDAYRMAKQSATDRGDYQAAGKYHYAEQSTRCTARWMSGWQRLWHPETPRSAKNRWGRFKARWVQRIRGLRTCVWALGEMVFARFLFAYGERVRGILAATALVIFGWSFTYCHSGIVAGRTAEGVPILTHSFRDCLYFSVVTFTTLGYGDLQPVESIRAWAATEALLGAFLMALFVVGMARKFTR